MPVYFQCKKADCNRVLLPWQKILGNNSIECICPSCGTTNIFTSEDTP